MAGVAGQSLAFRSVTMRFGATEVLAATDLEVAAGEFLTLLGPSGSGKTTLLNIAAGYLDPTTGRVLIGGRDVTGLAPRHRHVAMVFQNYALFPHMTVGQNVAYGPTVRRLPRAEIDRRVADALAVTRMAAFAGRSVEALSGGQRQRVALARAIATEPHVILMDEPLGALDRQLRKEVQLEIRRLHETHGRTTVYVTHDQEEALVMSDRIAVLREGEIAQIGTPEELYHRPNSDFIARFIGESNLVAGRVVALRDGEAELEAAALGARFRAAAAAGVREGEDCVLVIRPEHVRLSPGAGGLSGRVLERVFLGEIAAARLRLADGTEFWSRGLASERVAGEGPFRLTWDERWARIVPVDRPRR